MTNQLLEIPNIPCEQVPEGKDAADNVVVKEGGEKLTSAQTLSATGIS